MNRKFWISSLIMLWLSVPLVAQAAEMTGHEIMKKQKELHKVQNEIGDEIMLLVDKDGGKEKRQVKRYAKGSKKNYFMGTDFTYEDMEPEDIDNFNYTILRSEKLNQDKKDSDCYVIEAVPANEEKKRESGYSRGIMWIEKEYLYTLKVEFYDRRGRLQKIQTNHEVKNVSGTIWRAKKSLMKHLVKKHKTLTGTTSRKINTSVKDSVFTERFILSGKHKQ